MKKMIWIGTHWIVSVRALGVELIGIVDFPYVGLLEVPVVL